ncbi:MAG: FAD-dependent thymidylate synthase [Ruminococcaceae bacterium]|nr:FAD-dependent thymidylate synthase [Oscillospiraceae bacterium]
MEVKLIAHTPNPDFVVAAAARTCYTTLPISTLMDRLDEEQAAEYVEMLSEMGHESPIEHVSFTFAIEGVSRSLLAQITRHRIASFSVRSQRYVSEKKFDYVTPPQIADCPEAQAIYDEIIEAEREAYNKISALLLEKRLAALPEEKREDKATVAAQRKIAAEDARYVLPNACETQMVVTMNARSLKNFFRLRCCNRAQWEIRELARRMLLEVRKVSPALFRDAGPACLSGPCPEGKMSCGKMAEMRKLYGGE